MGREILFKGKRKDTGEWIYGQYFENRRFKSHYIWVWEGENHKSYEVIEETVAQFIGHIACDRVQVFDKDILKEPMYGNTYAVEWLEDETGYLLREIGVNRENTECIVDMLDEGGEFIMLEVIGNLYESRQRGSLNEHKYTD